MIDFTRKQPLVEGNDYEDLDPRLRPAQPDSPMILDGDVIDGDPSLMLRCMIEELLQVGIEVEELRWMARQPHYQAMYAAYLQLGADEVNRMIDDAAACVGVGRYRTVELRGETQAVTLTIGGEPKHD